MSTSVTLPALGESVTEGTVSRWLKAVGDRVEADEPLLEVSTDKVDTEIPSPAAGVLLEIKAEEDDTVEVGAELAVIGDEGEGDSSSDDSSADDSESDDSGSDEASEPEQAEEPAAEEKAEEKPAEEKSEPKPAKKKSSGGGGTEVTLPALGESVTEGTVSRWLKSVGDSIEVDEALVEISTDKVDTEVPSPVAGTVLELKVSEDDSVEVGGVLAIVGDASDAESGDSEGDDSDSGQDAEPQRAAESDDSGSDDSATVSEPEEQADAGDEGGQAPIPAPSEKSESKPEPKAEEPKKEEAKAEPAKKSASESAGNPASARPSSRVGGADDSEGAYVTPLVRKLAAEHGVDLTSLTGTGVGGRIRKQDVLAAAEEAKKAAEAPAPAPAAAAAPTSPGAGAAAEPSADAAAKRGTTEKLSRMRKTIAKRMVESLQTSAQLTATVEVDLTSISRIRAVAKDDFKKREGASLSYLPFITKAAIETLRQIPKVNATIDTEAGTVTYSDSEDIGIAVDTEKGLMVPVIKDAGDYNIGGLAKKIGDLASRTRANKITPDELTGGTFTITNYGSAGTLFDTPIINQPQVAILGTGALVKRPMVMTDKNLGDTIAVRDMMYLSMTYDHRLVDGADAARFLAAVKERLEEGDFGGEFGV